MRNRAAVQRLHISISNHKLDILDALLIHVVHCIATSTTNTNYFNNRLMMFWEIKFVSYYWFKHDNCYLVVDSIFIFAIKIINQ